jgi:hypothetical protein
MGVILCQPQGRAQMRIFHNMVLRRMFRPMREKVGKGWKKLFTVYQMLG